MEKEIEQIKEQMRQMIQTSANIDELEREKLEKVNVTDHGFRLMKDSRKVIQPYYNGQIAGGR